MAVDSLGSKRRLTNYSHAKWEFRRRILRFFIKVIGFTLLVKLDSVEGLENVPSQGPAILLINHIAFVDPILVLHVLPRNIVPLAKVEVYDYPIIGIFPKLWGVIPVHRDEVDRRAVQKVLEVLRAGEIVLVAPEGTRSSHLSQGKEGIAYLASHAGTPIVPVAIEGTPGFPSLRFFSSRWRGPGARVVFGRPFKYHADLKHPNRDQLRLMTDEAMYILAAMLPEARRGYYSDFSRATRETIEWL